MTEQVQNLICGLIALVIVFAVPFALTLQAEIASRKGR
jgi:hypothetical protein